MLLWNYNHRNDDNNIIVYTRDDRQLIHYFIGTQELDFFILLVNSRYYKLEGIKKSHVIYNVLYYRFH